MPVDASNFQRAAAWLAKAKNDPSVPREKIARAEQNLNDFYANKSGEQYGPSAPIVSPSPQPEPERRGAIGGYYYEPSLNEFHDAVKNPQVFKAIGAPDVRLNQQKNQSAGAAYVESKVPELAALNKTDLEHLDESTPEYKAYAEYAYNKAKEKDPSVQRYSDLDIQKNPFRKALGATIKHGIPAALGAEETLGLKIPRRAIATMAQNTPDSAADAQYDPMGAPIGENHPEKADAVMRGARQLEELSPVANQVGQLGAYAVPIAPANAVSRSLLEHLGYEAANPFMKAAIGGTVGSYVAGSEGLVKDVAENPSATQDELMNNYVPRAATGALGGYVGDWVGQGAGKAQQTLRESPRWRSIKNLEDVGGGTTVGRGVVAPPAVRQNLREATNAREYRAPTDIAAEKVAPPIRENLDTKLTNQASKINKQVEEYVASPYGQEEHSAKPVVDRLIAMADRGTISLPVSGRSMSANKGAADAIRKNLQEFSEFQHVTPEEAQALAQQHNGVVLSSRQAEVLGLPTEPGKVHVVVPSKFNAEALLKKEDQIARNLKFDTREGGVDNPVLQELDKAFREVRDNFKYDAPEQPRNSADYSERPGRDVWTPMQRDDFRNQLSQEVPTESRLPTSQPSKEPLSSVGAEATEPPPLRSDPAPVAEIRGNKRYQEPSASEYAKMQNGEVVDKSGNGYQKFLDTEDFAPGYRLRANPNEVSSLSKLAQETDDLEAVMKANPGLSQEEAEAAVKAKQSLPQENYTPEFPKDQSEKTNWATPYNKRYNPSPFEEISSSKPRSEWSPNEDLYTSNPPENLSADEVLSEAPDSPHPSQQNKSLFPEVKDQEGIARKSEMARNEQAPDVGAVKGIVEKTDKAAEGLTPEELDAVHSYTSRKGEKVGSPEWNSAVKKLTVEKPTAGGPLYHGTRLPQAEIDKILKNKSFSIKKPTSTSYNDGVASAMAYSRANRGEPVIFKIADIDTGISLASKKLGISGTNNEKEILLNNKNFEVASSHKDSDGNLVIELKQKKTNPNQLTAKLDDGTEVHGFSALRRQQHEALTALEEAKRGTGAATKEGAHRRVLGYKTGEGSPYENEQLAKEADELNLRQQLEEVPATRDFPGLRARAFGGGGEGPMNALKDALGFRLDPVFGAIAGAPPNPYTAMPNTPAGRIQQYLFRQGVPMYPLLEAKGGLAGARYGNEIADRNKDKK